MYEECYLQKVINSMESLKLIKPTIEYKDQVLQAVQEFFDINSNIYWVGWLIKSLDNYELWLEQVDNDEDKETLPEWRVPAKQFILIREFDNKLIWFIQARLELNENLLQHWWHIWYSICPSERRKNYATAQLFSVLDLYNTLWVNEVLVTCDKTNIWSAKTIQKCGWILENELIDPTDWELIQRYWIDVKKWIEKWKSFFENMWFDVKIS